ncbi:MAG: FHA domain-containing protein [Planctomycetota bacterium]
MASLLVTTGPNKGDYYPLETKTHVIGRVAEASVQLVDDRISRQHCQIKYDWDTNTHVITDMGSRNGTEVIREGADPMKVASDAVPLHEGDKISVAGVEVRFTTEDFADKESAAKHAHLKRWFGEEFRNTMGM